MKKIGLFGGSFNPPHKGHMHLAETVYHALELDDVYLIPTKKPPHKSDRHYTLEQDRLTMCRLMAEYYAWLHISDFELHQNRMSYTYYTVRYFAELYPQDKLFLLVGGDMLSCFATWYAWQEILHYASLACIARTPDEYAALHICAENLRQYGEICLVNTESFVVSSTKIREMIQKNQNYSCYLPEKIVQYIKMRNLYMGSDADCIG